MFNYLSVTHHSFNLQLVSVKEARALQKLRADESGALKYMIDTKVYERLETRIVEHCTYMIQREVMFYTQSSDCLMKRSSAADMESFSIQVILAEHGSQVPGVNYPLL